MFNFKTLKIQIALIMIIPTVSMFYFSSKFMLDNYQNQQLATQLTKNIKTIQVISNLIHELQKERGLSALYLGKNSTVIKHALDAQRLVTDTYIEDFLSYYKKISQTKNIKQILEKLYNIPNTRIKIDSFDFTFKEQMQKYTKIINNLFQIIPKTNQQTKPELNNLFESILNLIYYKEYTGLERAYLSNIFAKDQANIQQIKYIQQIYLNESIYQKNFIKYLPTSLYINYKESKPENIEYKIQSFRNIILNSKKLKNFDIDSLSWYNIATDKIDYLNNTLNQVLKYTNHQINQNKLDATQALIYSILLWVLSIFAFLFIWYTLFKLINLEKTNINKLKHQQKSYSAINNISNAIVYVDNDKTLYHNLCKTLLDIDGFNVAWIAKVDTDNKKLIPYIAENIKLHKLEKLPFDISINEINTNTPTPVKAYFNDKYIISDTSQLSHIDICKNIIYSNTKKIISFPIYQNKQIVSILTLFSTQNTIFNIELIELIEKLLKDTSTTLEFLKLRENEQKMIKELHIASYAFESQEAMTITDTNGNIIKVNKAFEEITGYTAQEVIGKNPNILKSDKQSQDFYVNMWNDLKKYGKWKGEIYNKRKNGEIYPEILSITAIKNKHGETTNYLAQFLDISHLKQLQKEAEFKAEHDPLTSLTNRSKLKEETKKAFIYGKKNNIQHTFFFLDIDNFKYINDFYGHATGDDILIEIASRLKQCAKDGDIVARLGGDEFAMLSFDTGKEEFESIQQATQIAKIIQKIMKQPILIDGQAFEITFSIGIKIFPNHENRYEEVISHADIAMYKAKKAGKNNFAFFDTELDLELKQFSILEKEIKKAIKNKEFKPYYQPKVDIATNKMIGMEALVRWEHPTKGIISPDKFLPIINETKSVYIFETMLIEQILQHISGWQKDIQTFNHTIAINITPESFQNENFIPFLKNSLKKYHINPNIIELELIENTFMSDMEQAISKIKILKSIGIKFSIDDFGTGYSSLTYLQKLPIDHIKIDKSFIMDINKQSNKEIVKMIINFAKLFNLKVVAEGVENIKTLKFLQSFGCDYYQGYFFSRAISHQEIQELL